MGGDVSGETIPPLVQHISYRNVAMNPGATGDHFPGHYDPSYAQRQGQPTIYANSLHLFGLLDKALLEWAGPASFLMRRNVRLHSSMYAGDTVTVTGDVTARDGDVVHVLLQMTAQDGRIICTAESTVRLAT